MNTLAITPAPALNALQITLTPEAEAKKTAALAAAEFIMDVADPAGQQTAIAAAADLKRFARDVENAREETKKPFLNAGRDIDAAAKKAVEAINAEIKRLESLVATYQRKELAKAEEIRREQQRIADEIATKRRAAEADRLRQDEFAEPAPPVTVIVPPPAVAPKAEGAAVKTEYDFEVVDVEALYRWGGKRFVKLEADRGTLKYYLNNTTGLDVNSIPGIKVSENTKVSVRAAR